MPSNFERLLVFAYILIFHFGHLVFADENGPIPFAAALDVAGGSVSGVSALDAQDLDGDNFVDIVALEGGKHSGGNVTFAWFKAPINQSENWTRHEFNRPSPFRPFIGAVRLGDIDGDGDYDVVVAMDNHSGSTKSAYISWLENPRPGQAATSTSWPIHSIAENLSVHHINDMELADMDDNGSLDVISRALTPNQLLIYFGNGGSSWTQRSIDTTSIASTGEGFAIGDLDLDGQLDISINGFWLKGPSDAHNGTYLKYTIDANYVTKNANTKEAIGLINNDQFPDVIISPAEGFRSGKNHILAWYEGVADPTLSAAWVKHVLESNVNGRHTVSLADIDADLDLDVVSATAWNRWGQTKKIEVYYNLDGNGTYGNKQTVVTEKGLYSGVVRDIGNDSDLDIIGQDFYSGTSKPYFYESLRLTGGRGDNIAPQAPANLRVSD